MTLRSAITLFGFHLINANLLALAVLYDICGNGSAVDNRSAENGVFAVDNCEDLVKLNGLAGFNVKLLDEDNVALCHAVLLAAGHDDSMLHKLTILSSGLALMGAGHIRTSDPFNAARIAYHDSLELSMFF